ncbi:malate dehydrogenase [Candidatus Nitromaritima sp. SCGC AAA799-C22]|nr:malate dehydrogenase [Candidatus Nitromaritima sp. SCGC AAA799-C22]
MRPSFVSNAGDSIVVRLKLNDPIDAIAQTTAMIAEHDGRIGAIDIVRPLPDGGSIRDIHVYTSGPDHAEEIVSAIKKLPDVEFVRWSDRTFLAHLGGKIEIRNRIPVKTREDLSMAYTPGVGRVCTAIYKNPDDVYNLTTKRNTVAVVTDGSAVLGLGDIGPGAALPVMEGKAMLFKEFADIDAFPICLDTKDTEEIINIVKAISPGFGGINLEDIAAPRCFEIEDRLKEELDIPVFHDDQHGTAVVLTAALLNALKLVGKNAGEIKVVVLGAGAAGTACSKMMMRLGVKNIIACDRKGAIYKGREGLNEAKLWFAENANPDGVKGSLSDAIAGADAFVGVSGPKLLKVEDAQKMARDPIVFAMSNPVPEIMPEEARPHVAVMATGRSDYPNQINNVLCFPGIFRGALDCMARGINEEMKMAAARAIAEAISTDHLQPDYIIPSVFDSTIAEKVAGAVKKAAGESGIARRRSKANREESNG